MARGVMTSVSFKEFYFEQLVYLESQHSKSNFICELLKKHMEEEGVSIPQDEIDRYMEAKNNKQKYKAKTTKSEDAPLEQETPKKEVVVNDPPPKPSRRDIGWLTE